MSYVISNKDFVGLTDERSNQIKVAAKRRFEDNPNGHLTTDDLDRLTAVCKFAGNVRDANWLKSLKELHRSGKLARIKSNAPDFQTHVAHVQALVAQKVIPFGINDSVVLNDSGKVGRVIDFNPESEMYVVILNPFQMVQSKAENLSQPK